MNFKKQILPLFFLALLGSNCVEEFNPPAQGYENLLVVEAFLSDNGDPFEVKLSRSISIDTSAFIPEYGASVSLSKESGETYNLIESGTPGIYVSQGVIDTQIGRTYQIHIRTQIGTEYESSPVMMRETPKIDSVSYEIQERPGEGTKGVQIYINTHDATNNTQYYRWTWDETWEFRMPFNSNIIWEDSMIKDRNENIYICWKHGRSTSIDISTTRNLSEDQISEYPILFVSDQSDRLRVMYSINVKQNALSEDSYNFWKELKKVTENLGTLFDPQPSIVRGNIYNKNDETEVVLGYFDASTLQEQRIFIEKRDIPEIEIPSVLYCVDSLVYYGQIQEMVNYNWWLVAETADPLGATVYIMSSLQCIDCKFYGSNERPDYWY